MESTSDMPRESADIYVGVDVGGTNTDVAILLNQEIIGWAKVSTSENVTDGIALSIHAAIKEASHKINLKFEDIISRISRVNIGTTHFVNAVIQRKHLAKVALIRLCGTASGAVQPFIDFPTDLREVVQGRCYLVEGGYQYDGKEITPFSETEISEIGAELQKNNVKQLVVSGIFSPIKPDQEIAVKKIIHGIDSSISITLSHELGQIGLLERENASILNESLKPLALQTIQTFKKALNDIGLQCPFYLTQNDGTIVRSEDVEKFPVYTFSSGATNSMRGAAFLSGIEDGIIIDIGGTSSDIGVIHKGFPREASARVKIGGVNSNFRMPDVLSLGLGGGSYVRISEKDGTTSVGPDSVGYRIGERAMVFGGDTLTTTDIAVAKGLADIGDKQLVKSLDTALIEDVIQNIRQTLENGIDQMKVALGDCPVCLVGGGSILVDTSLPMVGVDKFEKPQYYQVANAVGAALGQISGSYDRLFNLSDISRQVALETAKAEAKANAIASGALPDTVRIVDIVETPITYITVPVTRIKIKAVGDIEKYSGTGFKVLRSADRNQYCEESPNKPDEFETDQVNNKPQKGSDETENLLLGHKGGQGTPLRETIPYIDPETGEWILNEYDVECCAIGAGILGCGGGGSPYIGRLLALKAIEEGKKLRVINPYRLKNKVGRIVPVAFMGAPIILVEKLISGKETETVLKDISQILTSSLSENDLQKDGEVELIADTGNLKPISSAEQRLERNVIALMSAEIGGLNAMEPLLLGASLGLPVVDCDGMGRAFPKLNQFLPFIYGCSPAPAVLADDKGNKVSVARVTSPEALEDYFRIKTVQFGFTAGIALGSLTPQDILSKSCLFSISRARRIGGAVLKARDQHTNPVDAILKEGQGVLLMSGKIADVRRVTEKGFNFGHVIVEGTEGLKNKRIKIDFQNENLIAYDDVSGKVLVTCPDLITLVDTELGLPIATEETRYGLRVSVLVLPAVPLMRTKKALEFVGPQSFGFQDIEYVSLCNLVEPEPIPPS